MIKLQNVNVYLHSNHILKDISVTIDQGDFIIVVGHNGAGKSTLFNTLAGKLPIHSGSILFDNVNFSSLSRAYQAEFVAQLHQKPQQNCVGSMTVAQNLALSNLKGKNASLKSAMSFFPQESVVKLQELYPNAHHLLQNKMSNLSGGQQQIIAFIMATLHTPKLLLLDEPTAALDPQAATNMLVFAKKLIERNKLTTIMITHDPHIALALGNKIWVLQQGRIVREINKNVEKYLSPEDLIGTIDYAKLV